MAVFNEELQKAKMDGSRKVMIRMVHKRESRRIPTSIIVDAKSVTKSGKIKDQSVMDEIEDLLMYYRKKCNKLSLSIDSMSINDLYDYLTKKEQAEERIDFLAFFRKYMEDNKEKKGIRNYRTAYNNLCAFVNRPTFWIDELNYDFLKRYEAYINGARAVSLYIGSIRAVFMEAQEQYNDEDRGIIRIPYSPFRKYKVPKQNVAEKRAVDASYIKAIYDLPYQVDEDGNILENRRNLAKDMFILSFMLIGMNSVDLYRCDNYKDGCIIYNRSKTKDRRSDKAEIHVEIQKVCNPIFQRYRDERGKRVFDFYTRYANEAGFNRGINIGLKEIVKEIGFSGNIEFYAARHSWATIARNDLGIDKATVHEALNHVDGSYSVTDLYIKKDFSAINKANKKVLDYVFSKAKKNICKKE